MSPLKKFNISGLAEWLKWEEHLPSKGDALSSNPSSTKKKKKLKFRASHSGVHL
jgi:hypothetical protein